MTINKKVIVIGWDGGTFKILDKMVKRGIMPNLKSLLNSGVRAKLFSTIPPITAPSWSSFRSGKKPENHGVFSFFKPPQNSFNIKDIKRHSSQSIDGISFWNILNFHGKKVIVVDVPLTNPPEVVDEIMISGMMTRGKRGVFVYPDRLKKELDTKFPDYFDKTLTDGMDISLRYLDDLINSLKEKVSLDLFLLDKYEWDVFVSIYSAVDTLQHYFWKFIDKNSIQYSENKRIQKRINNFFNILDQTLSEYLKHIDDGDNFIIISDHGFGPNNNIFYVNNFLLNEGLISIERKKISSYISKDLLKRLLIGFDFFKLRKFVKKEFRERVISRLESSPRIDWSNTKAYFRTSNEYGIYINLNSKYFCGNVDGDEYKILIERLIKKLKTLKNPYTGESIFESIYPKNEIYKNGKYIKDAPDIILIPANGIHLKGFNFFNTKRIVKKNTGFLSGFHEMDGVFIGFGSEFKKGYNAKPFFIYDIAPLILFLFKLPVDVNMDGEINREILRGDFIDLQVKKQKYTIRKNFIGIEMDENDSIDKLEGLGYL